MFDSYFWTAFLEFFNETCLNFYCPPNAYFCCADLLQRDDLWEECATAAVDYVHLVIRTLMYVIITYVFVGALCYLCYGRSEYVKKRVLFIIALPKDETMFFGPTIMQLRNSCEIHLLCITAEYYKLERERKRELWESCAALGIPAHHITFIRIGLKYKSTLGSRSKTAREIMQSHIESMMMEEVFTYGRGFGQDLNHASIFAGMDMYCQANEIPSYCQVYMLESVNVIRKYSSFADIALSMLTNKHIFVANKSDHDTIWNAMAKHKTPTPWYHMFYPLYSRYMYVNTYKLLVPDEDDIQIQLVEE